MVRFTLSRLPAAASPTIVAQSSATEPEFLFADAARPRFMAARWHRRDALLEGPFRIEQHILSYCELGGAVSTIVRPEGHRRARQHTGSISFLPAGTYQRWCLESAAEVAHLHLYIDPESFGDPAALGIVVDACDPWFDGFFRMLECELEEAREERPFELVDRLAPRLLARVRGLHQHQRAAPPGQVSPLRPFLLERVESHVEQHLGERLTLAPLAAIAAMSVDHFVRAFEQATGSTPHRWILERRLDAAAAQLRAGADPIRDVAHGCGFASAAHFATAFRRRHGVSPGQYRRSR